MTIIGIKFPFQKGSTKFPAQSFDDDVIADNITRILLTPRGSRVMRPNQGSDIWSFVFDNVGALLRARVDREVRRSIAAGEPRVRVLAVNVHEEVTANGQTLVIVEVAYMVNGNVTKTAVPFVKP